MTRKWPVVGAVLAVAWLFVRGLPIRPGPLLGELLLAVAVGVPVAYATRDLYVDRVDLTRTLRAVPYGLLYALAFLRELLVANLDVAYRTLAPSRPIHPGVLELPLRVQTDAAVTTIANSITLTPGTLTMDYDEERNVLYVHSIDARNRAAVVEPIRTWEDYALVVFDEPMQPGDPVPEVETDG